MKDLKERLKDILIREGKSDAESASDIGLNVVTFGSYFYRNSSKVKPRQKTLRLIERYVLAKEKEIHEKTAFKIL
jgi:hypothetical protein